MTYDEMNNFILDYIKFDISGRAIMLSGEWGSGKSYYIKNTLKPFLESEEGGKHKCAIVSLYGLTSTSDISKAIYLELRSIKKETESEAGNTAIVVGKIVAKTIANGLASKIGFDIGNVSDEDLQKVYDSLDLTGKLIVLEDIERTKIDLFELLGFVNNICENDRVKVLLVTNEPEIMTLEETKDENGKIIKRYTDSTVAYLRAKEKTIGDTIHFLFDYIPTIQHIIESFGPYLKKFNSRKNAEDIRDIFAIMTSANLRAFIFACQKSRNIFEFIHKENIQLSEEIEEIIFYGIIGFSQRRSKGETARFDRDSYVSAKHGVNEAIPLFLFCYDYIVFQTLSEEEIHKASTYYTDYLHKGKWNSGRDVDLKTIKKFFLKTEKEITEAISHLSEKILNGTIPYYDYGVLANYLIAIRYDVNIEFDFDNIFEAIIITLQQLDDEIEPESLFSSGFELNCEIAKLKYEETKQRMIDAINQGIVRDFPYDHQAIKEYRDRIKRIPQDRLQKRFASEIKIEFFEMMLQECSSEDICNLRSIFKEIYSNNAGLVLPEEELFAIKSIYRIVLKYQEYEKFDNIQKMQIRWLTDELRNILHLSNNPDSTMISD